MKIGFPPFFCVFTPFTVFHKGRKTRNKGVANADSVMTDGKIDELKIFNRALNKNEIL